MPNWFHYEKILTYTINLDLAEEGGYNVTVPALPGCVTQGESFDEAVAMAQDAISLWIEHLVETGQSVPQDTWPPQRLSQPGRSDS